MKYAGDEEAGVRGWESCGRRGAYTALQPVDGDLEGESSGQGMGQAAAVVAVDGVERTRVRCVARQEEDPRTHAK
jgi:hypothetical protein